MEERYIETKKELLCKIGYDICEISSPAVTSVPFNTSSIKDLHSNLHEFMKVGIQIVELNLDPILRKNLRTMLINLNDQFLRTQISELKPTEFSLVSRNDLIRKVFDICTFVKRYENEKPLYGVSGMIDKINSGVASSVYKGIERPISYIKLEAYGGRKDVVEWSSFVEDVHRLCDVGSYMLENMSSSQTLLPSEQMNLKEILRNVSELLAVFYSLLFDVIQLNVDSSNSLERSAVLLTNTIYLLRNILDTELNVWNPVVKNVYFNFVWKNNEQLERYATSLKVQLEKLFDIFTICSPSTSEWMQPFKEIKNLQQQLLSHVDFQKAKMKKALTLSSYSNSINHTMLKNHDNDRERIYRCLLYKMYLLIYNTSNSLLIFLESSSFKSVMSFFDWSKADQVINSFSDEIESLISKLETKKSQELLPLKSDLNMKTKDNVFIVSSYSDKIINRFKLMKEFLNKLVNCKDESAIQLPLQTLQLQPVQSCSSFASSSDQHRYKWITSSNINLPFDSDCLKLFLLFCKVQIMKAKVFLDKCSDDLLVDELKYMRYTEDNKPNIKHVPTNNSSNIITSNLIDNASNVPDYPVMGEIDPNISYGKNGDERLLNNIDILLKQSKDFHKRFNNIK